METSIKQLKTQRNGDNIVYGNHVYELRRQNKKSTAWSCKQYRTRRCPAYITTDLNKVVISQFKDYNHEPRS